MSVLPTQWTTTLSAVLSVPVVGLVAHRSLQRLQVVSRLTPPTKTAESEDAARKHRRTQYAISAVVFIVCGSWVAMNAFSMDSEFGADITWAVTVAGIVLPACFTLYQAFCLPAEWSLALGASTTKGVYLLKSTASDNMSTVARVLCLGITGLVVAGAYAHPQPSICVLSIGLLCTFLMSVPKGVSTRGFVYLTFGGFALFGLLHGLTMVLVAVIRIAFTPDDSDRGSGSRAEYHKKPVTSVFTTVFVTAMHVAMMRGLAAYIVLLNLRFDYSREASATEPLPAGEAAAIAPLFPLKPLVANPRLFRSSFIALVATYAVLYTAFALAGVDPIAWMYYTGAAGALVTISTSAITAYRLGELSAWWNYKEVWMPKVVPTDVEQDLETKVDVPEDQKPLIAADSKQ